jgi:hypothetical protein
MASNENHERTPDIEREMERVKRDLRWLVGIAYFCNEVMIMYLLMAMLALAIYYSFQS